MVGEPLDEVPTMNSLFWDQDRNGNVEHIAAHGVTPDDVAEVLELKPRFFQDRHDSLSVIALGPNSAGRYLAIVLTPTFVRGEWAVVTAHWLTKRRGENLFRRGDG